MGPTPTNAREHLASLGIDHGRLSHGDLVMMSYSLRGWQLVPVTPADAPPIVARVWLLATVNTRGRYTAPERPGHPADLGDGGALVDSVVLMAVLQRHFLSRAEPGWDDATLAGDLGLATDDLTRAQIVLDAVLELPLHGPRPALIGPHWWRARNHHVTPLQPS
ncbi:hypothetical protein OM076_42780 [Solirubrobacter ginsenosidimutans]|uniref:Uncharacterized protein n=1 Tax=Solirubrobacter ginsenosidimutans TaxID=490573 RepID=A0A9X3N8Z8_9ACTN|nr:hypothetical protein [Solirubrobacter ginsenosidimutans]MDA0167063.1 hypothetical protein [Solirubrobacter ginsenosidimutans]